MRFQQEVFIQLDSPNVQKVMDVFGKGVLSINDDNILTISSEKHQRALFQKALSEIKAISISGNNVYIDAGTGLDTYKMQLMKPESRIALLWDAGLRARSRELKELLRAEGVPIRLPRAKKIEGILVLSGSIIIMLLFILFIF